MKISLTCVFVDDQAKALAFYTEVLGFEPYSHPSARVFKGALVADGIPFTSFSVPNVEAEYDRLVAAGVRFTQPPTQMGPVTTAVFDDTCGNLIQLASQ